MSYASLDAKNVNVSTCYTELQSFQKAGGGGSRALLRIDKESDGRIVLRSVLDSELTLFDRISRFFFPKRYLLENVRTIVDKVLSNQDFKAKLARDKFE